MKNRMKRKRASKQEQKRTKKKNNHNESKRRTEPDEGVSVKYTNERHMHIIYVLAINTVLAMSSSDLERNMRFTYARAIEWNGRTQPSKWQENLWFGSDSRANRRTCRMDLLFLVIRAKMYFSRLILICSCVCVYVLLYSSRPAGEKEPRQWRKKANRRIERVTNQNTLPKWERVAKNISCIYAFVWISCRHMNNSTQQHPNKKRIQYTFECERNYHRDRFVNTKKKKMGESEKKQKYSRIQCAQFWHIFNIVFEGQTSGSVRLSHAKPCQGPKIVVSVPTKAPLIIADLWFAQLYSVGASLFCSGRSWLVLNVVLMPVRAVCVIMPHARTHNSANALLL